MDRWETIEKNIQPELLRRYSKSLGANVSYSKWLEWCEDDRTTGSMLSTGVPCTLYFFVDDTGEILGARLLSIHNIRFLTKLMDDIKKAIRENRLLDFKDEFLNRYNSGVIKNSKNND